MNQGPLHPPLRVLVVDDASVVRHALRALLMADPDIGLVDTAATGAVALRKLERSRPDAVILDVNMPEMNGLEALAAIRSTHLRLPVIMFSALTERGAEVTLDALFAGADDYITKPSGASSLAGSLEAVRDTLLPKLKKLCLRHRGATSPEGAGRQRRVLSSGPQAAAPEVIVMAASTGGPVVLVEVLERLPRDIAVPILIVQHMPPVFTRRMAERIVRATGLRAEEGRDGAPLSEAQIWVAPGDRHLSLKTTPEEAVVLAVTDGPRECDCRPAADVLFRSAAQLFGSRALACVFTGMGQDGLEGCRSLKAAGATIWAQDRDSSVVWGMPGHVVDAGLADRVLAPEAMSKALAKLLVEV